LLVNVPGRLGQMIAGGMPVILRIASTAPASIAGAKP
jgi:hypothetical protein